MSAPRGKLREFVSEIKHNEFMGYVFDENIEKIEQCLKSKNSFINIEKNNYAALAWSAGGRSDIFKMLLLKINLSENINLLNRLIKITIINGQHENAKLLSPYYDIEKNKYDIIELMKVMMDDNLILSLGDDYSLKKTMDLFFQNNIIKEVKEHIDENQIQNNVSLYFIKRMKVVLDREALKENIQPKNNKNKTYRI